LARAEPLPEPVDRILRRVQDELFELGAELATPDPAARGTRWIGPGHVRALEGEIDALEEGLPPLDQFVIPGGVRAAAMLHLGRAMCRRAERRLVALIRRGDEPISLSLLAYLNRLGDLLFVLARFASAQSGQTDVVWRKPPPAND
jgi:cob(I)alamin adenosyltransferase